MPFEHGRCRRVCSAAETQHYNRNEWCGVWPCSIQVDIASKSYWNDREGQGQEGLGPRRTMDEAPTVLPSQGDKKGLSTLKTAACVTTKSKLLVYRHLRPSASTFEHLLQCSIYIRFSSRLAGHCRLALSHTYHKNLPSWAQASPSFGHLLLPDSRVHRSSS